MQEYQRENSSSSFLMVLLLIILGFAGYSLWQKYNVQQTPIITAPDDGHTEAIKFSMRIVASNYKYEYINANYALKQLFITQQQGVVNKDTAELFTNAIYNVSYDLFADNNEYYLGKTTCLFPIETLSHSEQCLIYLDKTASVIFTGTKLDQYNIQLILKVTDGLVKKPLICVGYSPSVYNVQIDQFSKVTKPVRLASTYDRCFEFGQDLAESSLYYTVKFNSTQSANFTFILVDQGYDTDFNPTYEIDNELPDQLVTIQI